MRRTWPVYFLLLFLAGCAAYKELTPKPEVLPVERGYIELWNGDEQFTLDKDKKYFIKFPAPVRDNFVLVLRTNNKSIISYCFTAVFDDGVRPSDRIRDESAGSDTLSVYAIDTRVMTFYWVVDTVRADTRLTMHYRYMPRWRYLFEGRYAEFRETLRSNTIDRQTYESIGPEFRFDHFNFPKEKGDLGVKSGNLSAMRGELASLESFFPPEIAGSRDTAYVSYTALKSSLDDELRFQQDYAATLTFFERELTSRGNPRAFLGSAPVFADFLGQSGRYRKPIVDAGRELVIARLPEALPYYENQLKTKSDVKRISLDPAIEPVRRLFAACEQPYPSELQSLEGYVARYNIEAGALVAVAGRLGEVDKILQRNPSWLSDTLYAELLMRDEEAKAALVGSELDRYERQRRYPCTSMLNQELSTARTQVAGYQSIHARSRGVAARISASHWGEAEDELRAMHAAPEVNGPPAVRTHAGVFVAHLEADLFVRLKKETEQRVDAFISRNVATTENVPGLYKDSVFLPLHRMTFGIAGSATVSQRNQQIEEYLARAKTVRFPEGAIRALYADFVRNIANRGAEKAQAIAEHGRQYLGDDKQIKAYVSECDPTAPKWIVRAKEYRKVYAVPVSANPGGTNEYLFRLQLNIPSDAQFPVFDVTLKLPQEVAAKAGTEQWYQEITINKKPIKNEGRFRITSPKADNNYESLISPVQMDRGGSNILEVKFKYPGFRVFEISAMAQVPIIRKN